MEVLECILIIFTNCIEFDLIIKFAYSGQEMFCFLRRVLNGWVIIVPRFQTTIDEDEEWEKFQKGLTKRDKILEGKSKMSHSVHCPYFPDDKQEFWWIYVCDRKNHKLITVPHQVRYELIIMTL